MDAQKPLVKIGTTVAIGDWVGRVAEIRRDGVVLILDNLKTLPVDRKLIEEAAVAPCRIER